MDDVLLLPEHSGEFASTTDEVRQDFSNMLGNVPVMTLDGTHMHNWIRGMPVWNPERNRAGIQDYDVAFDHHGSLGDHSFFGKAGEGIRFYLIPDFGRCWIRESKCDLRSIEPGFLYAVHWYRRDVDLWKLHDKERSLTGRR